MSVKLYFEPDNSWLRVESDGTHSNVLFESLGGRYDKSTRTWKFPPIMASVYRLFAALPTTQISYTPEIAHRLDDNFGRPHDRHSGYIYPDNIRTQPLDFQYPAIQFLLSAPLGS